MNRQHLDMALLLLDGPHGRVDPAHQAHMAPICDWAKAIWNRWIERPVMEEALEAARRDIGASRRPPEGRFSTHV